MAKTRRQKAVADAAESAPQSPATSTAPGPQSSATLAVDIPEDLDFDALSSLLPDTRLDTPTPDAILYLYRLVVNQAADGDAAQRELEEARADLSRKDVELDGRPWRGLEPLCRVGQILGGRARRAGTRARGLLVVHAGGIRSALRWDK